MADFDLCALKSELTLDEGLRRIPYYDTRGNITIGIGHNLTANGLSDAAIDFVFNEDVNTALTALDTHVFWWRSLTSGRQRVMLNLCFNMGWTGLSSFHHFLSAMEQHDWPKAAQELKASLWFNQIGLRGPRMIQRLLATEDIH